MRDLFRPHGLKYRTACGVSLAGVCRGDHRGAPRPDAAVSATKPRAGAIAQQRGGRADGEGSGGPERMRRIGGREPPSGASHNTRGDRIRSAAAAIACRAVAVERVPKPDRDRATARQDQPAGWDAHERRAGAPSHRRGWVPESEPPGPGRTSRAGRKEGSSHGPGRSMWQSREGDRTP